MLLDLASLFGGLAILLIAGDVLVRGSVSLAQRLGIPSLIIGLTIVAFGTSAPEFVISVRAALDGAGGIAIGNVVGSNVANVLLVLGLPSILAATYCGDEGVTRSASFMIAVSLVFALFCYFGVIDRAAGVMLLALLVIFLTASVNVARKARRDRRRNELEAIDDEVGGVPSRLAVAIFFLVAGLAALPVGAQLTINGAVSIARAWHVSDTAIALTIVALGTSLPELSTTLMSAVRGHTGVAVGNIVGSNIFNLLAIIGATALIAPIAVPAEIVSFDIWAMLATSVLILLFAAFSATIGRVTGIAMTAGYALYIVIVFQIGAA
ncbi:cation:H+ antiporter [Rhodobium orientis]|uniref:Sodium:proton exchanger n=1 Tax=Rhodobium orientis TaxID=34017 RepID=A0A327JX54_9HYPH|nr:calcium/sodium antiporter [Rhodobium orientis]MBB4301154.1 cation:H+ antiporter [Rhodobium orientis]MBK5949835.1 sodium:proton exchanger [Rhodobium orientis]RAI30073.1 sodium:proton exchanger [Rhodobium orientis]